MAFHQGASSSSGENNTQLCLLKTCLMGDKTISLSSPELIKFICSNEHCNQGSFMHGKCFENYQDSILDAIKNSGRTLPRSWTGLDKQKNIQNIWSKQGYDSIMKYCKCPCNNGHIRKVDPMDDSSVGDISKKKQRKKSKNSKMTITIGLPTFTSTKNREHEGSDAQNISGSPRNRNNSISSNTSGSSFNSSSGGDIICASPLSNDGLLQRSIVSLQERSRHDSGGSIFQRRMDYSSFNSLPKHKINSYHIKMEDECSIGNDETRIFILSSFASNKMNRVPCVLCKHPLIIYDRYPLIDGTFFMSPRQHNKTSILVKMDGKQSYISAVCMGCLEGLSSIICRYCSKSWSGNHLILGTMYSYDIFAATPCCQEKLKCNNCSQLVIHPDQRFNFFSDYSQMVSCPHCGIQDAHFTKNLHYYVRNELTSAITQE